MASLLVSLGLTNLSVPERLQLLDEIAESLGPDLKQSPLTDHQKQELDRRAAALDADPTSARPWDEVEARILARLRQ